MPPPYDDKTFDTLELRKDEEWKQYYNAEALLNAKRLVFVLDLRKALGRTMNLYGVYIDDEAWNYKREELEGVIEHEKAHIIRHADEKFNPDNLFKKLRDGDYLGFRTETDKPFKSDEVGYTQEILGKMDHAQIYLQDLLSEKFSFRYLSGGDIWMNWPADIKEHRNMPTIYGFTQTYNWLYSLFIKNEARWLEDSPSTQVKVIKDIPADLKKEITDYLKKIYTDALKSFPELEEMSEFDGYIQLTRPE